MCTTPYRKADYSGVTTATVTYVYSREGDQKGVLTGSTKKCQMEGCRADRQMVRWPDGKVTWPCAKGMKLREDGHWQIR